MSVGDGMSIAEIGESLVELADTGYLTTAEEDFILAIAEDAEFRDEDFWDRLDEETQERLREIYRSTVDLDD